MMTDRLSLARQLSPLRKSTQATSIEQLTQEQLTHFGIDEQSEVGQCLTGFLNHIYAANIDVNELWPLTLNCLKGLDREDRIAYFNAKRFICFQLAKILDSLIKPMRKSYQSVISGQGARTAKGPYPIFDNVTAIFSSTPVITRTATYLYACTEWIDEAFQGKELLHEIYSRLMNPTSVSLANHVVDIEAGDEADQYFAWNFNSGMAAIDAIFANLVGYQDIILSSRNVYGGTYQLMHDWYAKQSNMDVGVEFFDGFTGEDFRLALEKAQVKYADRLAAGRHIYVFLESPCNPHGYVLDVPAICRLAHQHQLDVICDATVGTPFLTPVLQHEDLAARPDFVVHSYTKDMVGTGTTTAGVVIGRNERMFIPKGESVKAPRYDGVEVEYHWNESLFWNVYYIKGAFLDADKAFEVLNGMKTMEMRVLKKCINTLVLARVLNAHPFIGVKCAALQDNENNALCRSNMFLGLPAPLFTFDFDEAVKQGLSIQKFKQFFDSLEPVFGLQVSLGQVNTMVLCPALTSHSEMSDEALADAGISRTTIRVSVGDEDPRTLLAHLIKSSLHSLEKDLPDFSSSFMAPQAIDTLYKEVYLEVHRQFVEAAPTMTQMLA